MAFNLLASGRSNQPSMDDSVSLTMKCDPTSRPCETIWQSISWKWKVQISRSMMDGPGKHQKHEKWFERILRLMNFFPEKNKICQNSRRCLRLTAERHSGRLWRRLSRAWKRKTLRQITIQRSGWFNTLIVANSARPWNIHYQGVPGYRNSLSSPRRLSNSCFEIRDF